MINNKTSPDEPLTFDEVYTIAALFIVSYPRSNADKPQLLLKAFLARSRYYWPNQIRRRHYPSHPRLHPASMDGKTYIYAAFITVTGPIYTDVTPVQRGFTAVVPEGILTARAMLRGLLVRRKSMMRLLLRDLLFVEIIN
jgi:hypothetical protein